MMYLYSFFILCLQIAGIQCILWVRPEDVIADVGDTVFFYCSTNASSSKRMGIRWIYTTEANFQRPSHIYAHGSMFPLWRMKHINVTKSSEGLFTLTISAVNDTDVGFYTCMDLSDDSKTMAQLNTFTEHTHENHGKGKTKGRLPIFSVSIYDPLSETHGDKDPIIGLTIRINQSVNLSANAREEDVVEWLLSPADSPEQYFTLNCSDKFPRKDGCGGYTCGKNHSIYIARVKPCHAGTYTAEIEDGDSRTLMLVVDGTVEVTGANSYETTNASAATFDSFSTPALDGHSPNIAAWIVGGLFIAIGLVVATMIIIGVLLRNGNYRRLSCRRNIDNIEYQLQGQKQ